MIQPYPPSGGTGGPRDLWRVIAQLLTHFTVFSSFWVPFSCQLYRVACSGVTSSRVTELSSAELLIDTAGHRSVLVRIKRLHRAAPPRHE